MKPKAILWVVALVGACTSLEEKPVPADQANEATNAGTQQGPAGNETCVLGTLTNEGVECPAMQTPAGEVYTLIGDLAGNEAGAQICVCGPVADTSTCMQGTTLEITRIGSPDLCP